jgi:nucleoside-diphosphate-sugar epimerase
MKVLVTGAAGFVGRHLVWRLTNLGDDVVALVPPDIDPGPLEGYGATVRRASLTQPTALEDLAHFDAVYHLDEAMSGANEQILTQTNVDGTRHLYQACVDSGRPPVVVLLSSIAAAGPALSDETPRTEADPPSPCSPYGHSKLAAEEIARQYAARVPTTILRPAVLFGDGDRETLPLFKHAQRGRVRVPASLDHRISLVHIADLAHVMESACLHGERVHPDAPPSQGLYFVAAEETPTLGEILELLRKVLGQAIKAAVTTGLWGGLFSRLRSGPIRLNPNTITAGPWLADGHKAREQLPLKLRMTLEQRLIRTVDWYRREGWL